MNHTDENGNSDAIYFGTPEIFKPHIALPKPKDELGSLRFAPMTSAQPTIGNMLVTMGFF